MPPDVMVPMEVWALVSRCRLQHRWTHVLTELLTQVECAQGPSDNVLQWCSFSVRWLRHRAWLFGELHWGLWSGVHDVVRGPFYYKFHRGQDDCVVVMKNMGFYYRRQVSSDCHLPEAQFGTNFQLP